MIALPDRTVASDGRASNHTVGRARRTLEESPLFRGRSSLILIDEAEGTLVLEGRLPSYYLKQMLQTVLRNVEGVQQIENRVAVDWPRAEG